jgi:hypothetical protein
MLVALAVLDRFVPRAFPLKRISSPARTFVAMNAAALLAVLVFFVPPETLWRPTRMRKRATNRGYTRSLSRILFVFGTRPEAIKLCPLIQRLRSQPDDFEVRSASRPSTATCWTRFWRPSESVRISIST